MSWISFDVFSLLMRTNIDGSLDKVFRLNFTITLTSVFLFHLRKTAGRKLRETRGQMFNDLSNKWRKKGHAASHSSSKQTYYTVSPSHSFSWSYSISLSIEAQWRVPPKVGSRFPPMEQNRLYIIYRHFWIHFKNDQPLVSWFLLASLTVDFTLSQQEAQLWWKPLASAAVSFK